MTEKAAMTKRRIYTSQALNKHGKKLASWNKRIMFAVSAIYIDYFDETNEMRFQWVAATAMLMPVISGNTVHGIIPGTHTVHVLIAQIKYVYSQQQFTAWRLHRIAVPRTARSQFSTQRELKTDIFAICYSQSSRLEMQFLWVITL